MEAIVFDTFNLLSRLEHHTATPNGSSSKLPLLKAISLTGNKLHSEFQENGDP
jgi:hypothetical protein